MTSTGIFNVDQLNAIRDAHLAWCAENSVDPKSPLGQEGVAYLLQAFNADHHGPDELIMALDRYVGERASHVQIGSPPISSSDE